MNNSLLAIESLSLQVEESIDNSEHIQKREGDLLTVVDALQQVQQTQGWRILKERIFDGLVDTLTKEINAEARNDTPDTLKLNRLAGQLKWAEKYADLGKLEQAFKKELTNTKRMYGKTT